MLKSYTKFDLFHISIVVVMIIERIGE